MVAPALLTIQHDLNTTTAGDRHDLRHPGHRRWSRHRPGRPDRRAFLVPLALLVPVDRGRRRDGGDAAVRARVAGALARTNRLDRRGAARRLARGTAAPDQ